MVCMGKVAVELGVFVATVDSWVVGRGGSVGNVALGVVVCMGDGLGGWRRGGPGASVRGMRSAKWCTREPWNRRTRQDPA